VNIIEGLQVRVSHEINEDKSYGLIKARKHYP